MKTRLMIGRLELFELMPMHRCEPGRPFIYSGGLFVRTEVDNHYNLLAHLNHPEGMIFSQLETHGHKVMTLREMESFVTVEPDGEPIPEADIKTLADHVALTDKGAALCGSLSKKGDPRDADGRAALVFKDMQTYFHDRAFPHAWASWRIAWYDSDGNLLLQIRRN